MRISLATKIFLGFSLVLAVFGAVSIYGITQLNQQRDQLNSVNRGLLPLDRSAALIETLQESARKSIESVLHIDNLDRQRTLLEKSLLSFGRNMRERLDQARKTLEQVESPAITPKDSGDLLKRLEQIGARVDDFTGSLESLLMGIDPELNLAAEPEPQEEFTRTGRLLAREVRLLKQYLKNLITKKMEAIERDASAATVVILWFTIVSVLVSVVVTVLSLLALRPIRRLAEAARRVSQGDFATAVTVRSRDEFGLLAQEFNRMTRSLALREEDRLSQQQKLEQANRELRRSGLDLELMKLYNENIVRSIQNGILVADSLGVVTTVNPAAIALWGLEGERTVGRRLDELPIAAAITRLTSSWAKILREKERVVLEQVAFPVRDAAAPGGKREVLVDLYVSPLVGKDGNTQGLLLVGEDVTDKVRTKQALIQSERLATIGRMSAVVAHEIRNPLSSITLNTELLEEGLAARLEATDREPRELLGSISREVERLTEVTEEYLRFARLPKPELLSGSLNEVLLDLLRFVDTECQQARVTVRRELEPALPPVRVDEGQLRQAFLNLLKNSLESMPDGGVLTVATRVVSDRVAVLFCDTGRGIAQGCLDKIFDPFFSTRQGGTGLGLSLTQQIVTEHGGTITCQSRIGEGTTFRVELPAAKGPA